MDAAMDTQSPPPENKNFEPSLEVTQLIEKMRQALVADPEDPEQASLVKLIQENRTLLLQYAMSQYLLNPKSSSLLEGVNALLGQFEKSIRDDRKEAAKKKDAENNVLSFNEMLEAMKNISNGTIIIPQFDMGEFLLDPNKSLVPITKDMAPINEQELVQGNQLADINGDLIKE